MKKIATKEIWTTGLVNVPKNPELKDCRYTLFELDSKRIPDVRKILEVYTEMLGSVYIHELINGFHFYNLKPISKTIYWDIIKEIKQLNPECPLTTLRIIPNKWRNEQKFWSKSAIVGYPDEKLEEFRRWLEGGHYHMISNNYQTVRYPLEECPICHDARNILYFESKQAFYCDLCGSQTKGRIPLK